MPGPPRPTDTGVQLDPENPWPGLESFDESAFRYFHGRDDETEELLRRVVDAPVTVLFGKSGLGKTSLLKAGLFPRLRVRHFLPVHVRLEVRPGAPSFIDQLRDALLAAITNERVDVSPIGADTLWEYLHRADLELWSEQNYPLVPVLVVDQFEELFTLGERLQREVHLFRSDFGDLAENRIPTSLASQLSVDSMAAQRFDLRRMPYKLVVSLRDDFLPHLEGWRTAIPSLGGVRVRLLPMRPDQALSAVYETAPHLTDEALARKIVAFVGAAQTTRMVGEQSAEVALAGEIEPALLSLFCRGLNERRKRQGKVRFDDQLLEGVQQSIIADYYRESVEHLPERASRFIESELITANGFRNSYAREDAVPRYLTDEQLQELIDRRLLRLEERYGTSRIELTHDVLTRAVLEHRLRRQAEDEKAALARQEAERRAALESETKRQRRRLVAMSLVALLCLALAGLAGVQWRKAVSERQRAMASQAEAETARAAAIRAQESALEEQRRAEQQEELARSQAALAAERARDANEAREAAEQQARVAFSRELAATAAPLADASSGSDRELGILLAMQAVWATYSADRTVTREAEDALRRAVGGSTAELPFPGHADPVEQIAFSPDGTRLATCAGDRTVRVWEVPSGVELRRAELDACGALAFGSNGIRVAHHQPQTRWPAETTVRDVLSGASLFDRTGDFKEDDIEQIAFSPDGTRLVTADRDGRLSAWDLSHGGASPRPLPTRVPKSRRSAPLAVSANGARVAVMDEEGILHVAPLAEEAGGAVSLRLDVGAQVALSPDGTLVASSARVAEGGGAKLQVWDAATGAEIVSWDARGIVGMVFSAPEGRYLATATDETSVTQIRREQAINVWDVGRRANKPVQTFRGQWPIAFSADGSCLAFAQGSSVVVHDLGSGKEVATFFGRREASLVKAAFGSGTSRLATASRDGKLRIWDTAARRPVHTVDAGEQVELVVVSPSADLVAAWGRDRGLQVWRVSGGDLAPGPVIRDLVSDAAFLTNGTRIVTGAPGGAITVRDTASGEPVDVQDPLRRRESRVFAVQFSPDERRVATATVRGGLVHDIATGRTLLEVPLMRLDVAFAGKNAGWFAAGGQDVTDVWDVDARKKLTREPIPGLGPASEIRRRRLALSPDGRLLAVVDQAGRTVSVWDSVTGIRRTTLHRHGADVLALAFTLDGARVAVALSDWSVHSHPLAISELLALARERVSRSLTTEECQRYLGRPACPTVHLR